MTGLNERAQFLADVQLREAVLALRRLARQRNARGDFVAADEAHAASFYISGCRKAVQGYMCPEEARFL